MLESEEVELRSIPITFEKALKLETTVIKGCGWTVEPNRSPTVCYNNTQLHACMHSYSIGNKTCCKYLMHINIIICVYY